MRDLLPTVEVPFLTSATGTVFLLLFLGILCVTYSRKRKQHYEDMGSKAIDESDR